MLNRLDRPISRWMQFASRLLSDDAGTAAVLAPQYSLDAAFPALRAQLFAPAIARAPSDIASIGFQQQPVIRPEGNHSVEYRAAKRAIDIIGGASSVDCFVANSVNGVDRAFGYDARKAAVLSGARRTLRKAVSNVQVSHDAAGCG